MMDQEEHRTCYVMQGTEPSSVRDREKPHCSYCKNHSKVSTTKQHNCSFKSYCKCILCLLTRKAQIIMRHQQRVWRFQNQKNINSDSSRYQKCDNCRNHCEFKRKSSHTCPFEECDCSLCELTSKRRKIMKHIQRARRLKITMDSICDLPEGSEENFERLTESGNEELKNTIEEYSKHSELQSLLSGDNDFSMLYLDKKNNNSNESPSSRRYPNKVRVTPNKQKKKKKNDHANFLSHQESNSAYFDKQGSNAYHQRPPSPVVIYDIPKQSEISRMPQINEEKELPQLIRLRDFSNEEMEDEKKPLDLIRMRHYSSDSTEEKKKDLKRFEFTGRDMKIFQKSPQIDPKLLGKTESKIYPIFKTSDCHPTNYNFRQEADAFRNGMNFNSSAFRSYPPSVWHTPSVFSPSSLVLPHQMETSHSVRQPVRPKPILANIPPLASPWNNFPVPDLLYLNTQWLAYAQDFHRNYNRSLFPPRQPSKVSNFLEAMSPPAPTENLRNGINPWFFPPKE